MAAPEGNRFWEARSSHGRKPLFDNPEDLRDACHQYFEWNDDNPLFEDKVTHYQGVPLELPVSKMRAMTIQAMTLFIGMSHETWIKYRQKKDFSEVCTYAEQVMYAQKFAGAAADQLNPSIIARDLALVDKSETTHKLTDLSDEELQRRLTQLED